MTKKIVILSILLAVFMVGEFALAQVAAPPTGPKKPSNRMSATSPVLLRTPCKPISIEFVSPVVTEFVPNVAGDCWEIVLEASINQTYLWPIVHVAESFNLVAPGMAVMPPTDINGDGIVGDPNPLFPELIVTLDEPICAGAICFPGGNVVNLASLFHKAGSERELDRTQTTTFAMTVDPAINGITDSNGDGLATLTVQLGSAIDTVTFQIGAPTANMGTTQPPEPPTISFFTPDWLSAVDFCSCFTSWALGIEVRIPAVIDHVTNQAYAIDPIPGPYMPPLGVSPQIQTCFAPIAPAPGAPNPNFPSLVLVFSDDYVDNPTGTPFLGGTISGSTTGYPVTLRSTGQNMATLIQEVGVSYWYGIDGIPDALNPPGGIQDDQIIYRFVAHMDGILFDTDILPQEFIATAGITTYGGLSAITNVRIKHAQTFVTPDP